MAQINLPLTASELGQITTKEPALEVTDADGTNGDPYYICALRDGQYVLENFSAGVGAGVQSILSIGAGQPLLHAPGPNALISALQSLDGTVSFNKEGDGSVDLSAPGSGLEAVVDDIDPHLGGHLHNNNFAILFQNPDDTENFGQIYTDLDNVFTIQAHSQVAIANPGQADLPMIVRTSELDLDAPQIQLTQIPGTVPGGLVGFADDKGTLVALPPPPLDYEQVDTDSADHAIPTNDTYVNIGLSITASQDVEAPADVFVSFDVSNPTNQACTLDVSFEVDNVPVGSALTYVIPGHGATGETTIVSAVLQTLDTLNENEVVEVIVKANEQPTTVGLGAYRYQGSTITPVSSGQFRTNNANSLAATTIRIHRVNRAGQDRSQFLDNIFIGGQLAMTHEGQLVAYTVTGSTPDTDWVDVTVTNQVGDSFTWASNRDTEISIDFDNNAAAPVVKGTLTPSVFRIRKTAGGGTGFVDTSIERIYTATQFSKWEPAGGEAIIDLDKGPDQTTTLTGNQVVSTIGSLPAGVSTQIRLEVTANGNNLGIPAAWDPQGLYQQPGVNVFVLAFNVLSDGSLRYAGSL